ncbi:hypothetical protein [Caldimonas brevitalea]|uniref:Lysozyme inhibitor n=1 Tax=Caldimonas brevitalea TaxID=413882 RepID=A0A0G3BP26_9BURK|nr:hypothetical protein [Caldimonas brevitalea]AKJ28265.1 hypothetical protein AAW51_1574 [Caldimonas brevitalea]
MRKTLIRAAAIGASALIAVSFAHAEKKPSKKKAAAAAAAPAPASPEQLEAAERVHIGESQCEYKQSVDLAHNATYPGYVDLTYGKRKYLMKPVLSGTGAMRLEDVRGETLYLQIANKSMLMNVKSGQRMVDDCVHAKQREVADALKAAATNN